MRWPMPAILPSFLVSMWISSPGPLALITHGRWPRLQGGEAAEAEAAEHQADGGDRAPQPARDLRPGQALPAQALDRVADLER